MASNPVAPSPSTRMPALPQQLASFAASTTKSVVGTMPWSLYKSHECSRTLPSFARTASLRACSLSFEFSSHLAMLLSSAPASVMLLVGAVCHRREHDKPRQR